MKLISLPLPSVAVSGEGAVPAIDRLPVAILRRQITPGTAVSQPEKQGVKNQFHRDLWTSALVYNTTFFKSRVLSGPHQ
jgi:hypothetical protein